METEVNKILETVIKRITPTAEEHKEEMKIINEVCRRIEKYKVKPVVVGSMAKGTDIRGDKDLDIFIMFHKDVPREKLEEEGLYIGRKVFEEMNIPYEIDYAEHPYVNGLYKNYNIEIVPCYDTAETKSAVDRTPYHTYYVKKKLQKNPELRDDIRLLKQFMKASNVYGAEAKVEGFSGYICELLVLNYGGFIEVVKAASGWRFGEVIDPEKLWRSVDEVKHFFPDASLIIVDPVDMYRNAASAVSRQRMAEFMVKCRDFLNKPSLGYFFPQEEKPPDVDELLERIKSRGGLVLALKFTHPRINPNTLYSQLRKTCEAVSRSVEGQGFRILKKGFWTDEEHVSLLIYEMEVYVLPKVRKWFGPPVDKALKEQEKFLKKYDIYKPYIEDGVWVADIKRSYTDVRDLLADVVEKKEGFGKNLRTLENIELVDGYKLVSDASPELLKYLNRFFTSCP